MIERERVKTLARDKAQDAIADLEFDLDLLEGSEAEKKQHAESLRKSYVRKIVNVLYGRGGNAGDPEFKQAWDEADGVGRQEIIDAIKELLVGQFPILETMAAEVIRQIADAETQGLPQDDEQTKNELSGLKLILEDLKAVIGSQIGKELSILEGIINLLGDEDYLTDEVVQAEVKNDLAQIKLEQIKILLKKAGVAKEIIDNKLVKLYKGLLVIVNAIEAKKAPKIPEPEKDAQLDISIETFKSMEFEKQKKWILGVLSAIKNSDPFDISISPANKGIKLYGQVWDAALIDLRSKGEGSKEARLAEWVKCNLRLHDAVSMSVAAYGVDYQTLEKGGHAYLDETKKWGGLAAEGGEVLIASQLKYLFSESTELDKGDAAKIEFIIDVAYSWFRGEEYPGENKNFIGTKYSKDLRTKHTDAVKEALVLARKDLGVKAGSPPFPAMGNYIKYESAFADALAFVAKAIDMPDHVLSVAKQAVMIFDLRNIVAQNNFAAAASPADRGTIALGASTEIFNRGALISYGTMGKNKGGMFNPDLALSVLPKRAVDMMRGKDGNIFNVFYQLQLQVTRAWLDYYAPAPQEYVQGLVYESTESSDALVGGGKQREFYAENERRHRYNPYPRMGEYLWLDLDVRDRFLDEKSNITDFLPALKYYAETMAKYKAFVELTIDGKSLSFPEITNESSFEDVEELLRAKVGPLIEGIGSAVSPTKPMIRKRDIKDGRVTPNDEWGVDTYYMAKASYLYIRQLILAFGEACWGRLSPEKQNLYVAMLCELVCATLPETMSTIDVYDPSTGKATNLLAYLLDRLPNPHTSLSITNQRMVSTWLKSGSGKDLQQEWVNAIYYNGDRAKNNEHELKDLRKPHQHDYKERLSLWTRRSVLGISEATRYLADREGFVKKHLAKGQPDSPNADSSLGYLRSIKEGEGDSAKRIPITPDMLWQRVKLPAKVAESKGKEAVDEAKSEAKK